MPRLFILIPQSMVMHDVNEYLKSLTDGEQPLSAKTIRNYRQALLSFANFIGTDIAQLHNHLTPVNLKNYGASLKNHKPSSINLNMSIVRRFYWINDAPVANGRLEEQTMRRRKKVNPNLHTDVPLPLSRLQDMMAIADVRGKAILSFAISTGCRAGEMSLLRLSDVDGDVVTIPDEYAKGQRGGVVYLTSEAKDYLDKWLSVRPEYLKSANKRNKTLVKRGYSSKYTTDDRIFGITYNSMQGIFSRLYARTGGKRSSGKVTHAYKNRVTGDVKTALPTYAQLTLHSCRRYFSTHAQETMTKDLVEYLMRHTGYLSSSYYRNEKAKREFQRGEFALYINKNREDTRDDEVAQLQDTVESLKKDMAEVVKELVRLKGN